MTTRLEEEIVKALYQFAIDNLYVYQIYGCCEAHDATSGACRECYRKKGEGHYDTCVIGNALSEYEAGLVSPK